MKIDTLPTYHLDWQNSGFFFNWGKKFRDFIGKVGGKMIILATVEETSKYELVENNKK